MNYYGFAHPVRALFAGLDIAFDPVQVSLPECMVWLAEVAAKLPWENQLAQLNQLDSHDTMRFITMIGGNESRMKAALILLFTYVGAPCLYYGTELGLEGGHDPDNRRPMPWERADSSEWLPVIRQLAQIRRNHPALQCGSFQILTLNEQWVAYARQLEDNFVITVLVIDVARDQSVTIPLWKLGCEQGELKGLTSDRNYPVKDGEVSVTVNVGESAIFELKLSDEFNE